MQDVHAPPTVDARSEYFDVRAPAVDIVVPVYNEQAVLDASVRRLHEYLTSHFPFTWRITIVDNASTDDTLHRALRLARDLPRVNAMHLDQKGRGLALRTAWSASDAAVVAYMDVDLSTDLDALLPLVAPLKSGHSDIAIGSRLALGSSVARGPQRELISRGYNAMLRTMFAARFRDAQCGFKAVRADVARRLLPAIVDNGWFFDTELLLLAEHNGLRVHEVPVDWIDDPDSRVDVAHTALHDLKGAARMARTFLSGGGRIDLGPAARSPLADDFGRSIVRFGLIGLASTAVSLTIFLLLHDALGAVAANAVAVLSTFVANTWANARYTGHRARPRWLAATGLILLALALTSVGLLAVGALGGGLGWELAVLLCTWTLAGALRLAAIRSWSRAEVHA